jgi:hypothetical protein
MARGREWRRHTKNKKFIRVRRSVFEQYRYSLSYYRTMGWKVAPDYKKRNSIDEYVTVTVDTESQYHEFISFIARLKRDNPKTCNCDMCRGYRKNGYGNSKKVLTVEEQQSIQDFLEEVRDTDSKIRDFTWRSRGRCKQVDRDAE